MLAILSVVSRILLLKFNFGPWMFSFIQLCAGGVTLLVMSGKGVLDPTSFRRSVTWILRALWVISAAQYMTILAMISVLEAGVLGAVCLPIIVVVVWIMTRIEWIGHLLILGAILFLVRGLEPEIQLYAAVLMGSGLLATAALFLIARLMKADCKIPNQLLKVT